MVDKAECWQFSIDIHIYIEGEREREKEQVECWNSMYLLDIREVNILTQLCLRDLAVDGSFVC